VRVYVEIRNVTEPGESKELQFNDYLSFQWEMTDEGGQPIDVIPHLDEELSFSYWINLPYDSTMRLFVTVGDNQLFREQPFQLGRLGFCLKAGGGPWNISRIKAPQVYLSAIFTSARFPQPVEAKKAIWNGRLALPRALLPERSN
jgi:hypothetical protein